MRFSFLETKFYYPKQARPERNFARKITPQNNASNLKTPPIDHFEVFKIQKLCVTLQATVRIKFDMKAAG